MKTKRKLKGMTLMEVVVSLAVYAVIGLLIAEIMTLVNATMKATNQLNRRLSYEAKFADNQLLSDGAQPFDRSDVTVNLHGPSSAFNLSTSGSAYHTNAGNMERQEQNLIINGNTNYRFLVFRKAAASTPTTISVFHIELKLGECSDIASNPITKMIVKGQGVPERKGMFAYGTDAGALYQQMVLYDTHTPPAGDSIDEDSNPGIAVNVPGMESYAVGNPILRISVPAVEDDGVTSIAPTGPNEDDPVKGHITVQIFRTVHDQLNRNYNWFTQADVDKLKIGFALGDARVDSQRFPAVAVLNLDFVLSAVNPNTHERSFYEGVTYQWNPDRNPNDSDYLVAESATARL